MKLLLCVLDGIGINKNIKGNAFKLANTPNIDFLLKTYSHSKLDASGLKVGLAKTNVGNSEAGYNNIGSGRIVTQSIQMINNSIKDKTFNNNKNILEIFKYVKDNNKKLHLMGLVSDGCIHSSLKHLQALINLCNKNKIEFYLHIITDGRDTLPKSSLNYIESLDLKNGHIASISGRYYTMDKDSRYDRIEKVYDVITGNSDSKYLNVKTAINSNYENNITDEFILPGIIDEDGIIEKEDAVILFNFRSDRIKELANALTNKNFNEFKRKKEVNVKLLTMMPINDLDNKSIYKENKIDNTLGEYLNKLNYKQLGITESENESNITYFFDGNKELNNCNKIIIPSSNVATYDLKPEMSAYEITDTLLNEIDKYDFLMVNYSNCDMLGHTCNIDAIIKSIEIIDECIGKIYEKVRDLNGMLVITSSHGNCEEMIDENNNIYPSHTKNKVPFIITTNKKLKNGKLADIAPTILHILNEKIPNEMTGDVLIED